MAFLSSPSSKVRSAIPKMRSPAPKRSGGAPPTHKFNQAMIQMSRGNQADAQRQAGLALAQGKQTGGFRPFGQPSLAERLPPDLLSKLNPATRTMLANIPIMQGSTPYGAGAQVQKREGAGSIFENSLVNPAPPQHLQVGTAGDPNAIPADVYGHEAMHVLENANPRASIAIENMFGPELKKAAAESYYGGFSPTDKLGLLSRLTYYNPLTWATRALGISNASERFAEGMKDSGFAPWQGADVTPEQRAALLQFFNPEAMDPALSRGLQRNAAGQIMLPPPE